MIGPRPLCMHLINGKEDPLPQTTKQSPAYYKVTCNAKRRRVSSYVGYLPSCLSVCAACLPISTAIIPGQRLENSEGIPFHAAGWMDAPPRIPCLLLLAGPLGMRACTALFGAPLFLSISLYGLAKLILLCASFLQEPVKPQLGRISGRVSSNM